MIRSFALVPLWIHFVCGFSSTLVADDNLRDEIWKVWQERELRFQTVEICWKERTLRREAEVAKTTERSFLLGENGHARYTRTGPLWRHNLEDGGLVLGAGGRFIDQTFFSVVNDTHTLSFYGEPKKPTPMDYPKGFIRKRGGNIWADNIRYYYPIRYAFRPTQWLGRYSMKIKSPHVEYRGSNCVVVAVDGQIDLFLDRDKDYVCIRHLTKSGDFLTTDMSIKYEYRHGEWLPKSWTTLNFLPPATKELEEENFMEKSQAVVTTVEINPKFDPRAFSTIFPAGTLVTDRSQGKNAIVFLTRPDGEKRIVTREERRGGIRYKDYLRTESGKAIRPLPHN